MRAKTLGIDEPTRKPRPLVGGKDRGGSDDIWPRYLQKEKMGMREGLRDEKGSARVRMVYKRRTIVERTRLLSGSFGIHPGPHVCTTRMKPPGHGEAKASLGDLRHAIEDK